MAIDGDDDRLCARREIESFVEEGLTVEEP
jgi:hypothetical protein